MRRETSLGGCGCGYRLRKHGSRCERGAGCWGVSGCECEGEVLVGAIMEGFGVQNKGLGGGGGGGG